MDFTEQELVNHILRVKMVGISLSDVISIFAIAISLLTLYRQNRIHKENIQWQKDIHDQEIENRKQEKQANNKMQKWSAEYPHKLNLITDFYDTLFRFINYKGSIEKILTNAGTQNKLDVRIRVSDIMNFVSQINRIDEESQILFKNNKTIIQNIHSIWRKVKNFVEHPINDPRSLPDLEPIISNIHNIQNSELYKQLKISLETLQQEIKEYKMLETLRSEFQREVRLKNHP